MNVTKCLTCFDSSGYEYSSECDGGDPCYSDPEENNRNRGRHSSFYSPEVGPSKFFLFLIDLLES